MQQTENAADSKRSRQKMQQTENAAGVPPAAAISWSACPVEAALISDWLPVRRTSDRLPVALLYEVNSAAL